MPQDPSAYPASFKVKVAVASLRGDASVAEVAKIYGVTAQAVTRWRRQLLKAAPAALAVDTPAKAAKAEEIPTVPELPVDLEDSAQNPIRFMFSNNLLYWSRLVETHINREFTNEIHPHRISVTIWRILAWLVHLEALTVNQLAAYTHMERTVLSRVLDRMVEEDLVRRTRNDEDRRVSTTTVTAKGLKLFQHIQPIRDALYRRATASLSQEQLDTARDVFRAMVDNLNASPETLDPPVSERPKSRGRAS